VLVEAILAERGAPAAGRERPPRTGAKAVKNTGGAGAERVTCSLRLRRFDIRPVATGDRASALHHLGRSREARPLQIAPEFAHASVEVVGS
jgi:hypothetical protein